MKKALPIFLAVAGISGVAAFVPAVAQHSMARNGASLAYVGKAGAGDLYEIRSSEIAVQRTRDPRVRALARMLITDHNRSTQQVLAAARASGLRPGPAMLEPAQRGMIGELQRAPAARFDRVYLAQQITAHQQALNLHGRYARTGDLPALRRVAAGIVPVVQGHLAQARRLSH
jgi:putative membrane protein